MSKRRRRVATVQAPSVSGSLSKAALPSTWGATWTHVVLLGIVLAGAYLRLVRLDDCALRADTINFWTICHSDMMAWDVVRKWAVLGLDHPPTTLVITKWLIDSLRLPVTEGTLTVVPAIFGVLCIPVMFRIGLRVGGQRLGLLLAGLLAINPIHIQVSREAYHYSLLLLGSCLMLSATLDAVASVRGQRGLGVRFYVLVAMGVLGLTLSTFTGWSIAAIDGLVIVSVFTWRVWRGTLPLRVLVFTALLLAVCAVPTLAAPWGLSHIFGKMGGSEKEIAQRIVGSESGALWRFLRELPVYFGWGATGIRFAFTAFAAAACACVAWRDRDRRASCVVCAGVGVAGIAVFLAVREAIAAGYGVRYLVVLLPHAIALLGVGVWGWSQILPEAWGLPNRFRTAAFGLTSAVAITLFVNPAWDSARIIGQPTPYKVIQAWFNTHLPQGTPVLVDRWLEPWNELRVYNSTNVFFTFTIPNEPVDVFLKYNWRESAVAFFRKYPDAAYLEISKSYWTDARVGPWNWPRQHFKHHVEFRNAPGLELDRLGLLNRGGGPLYKAGLIVELYYNTREDVLNAARAEGRNTLVLYGQGWGYTKLWQQIQGDFRDWRVLRHAGTLDIFNLGTVSADSMLTVRAVALGGAIRARASTGAEFTFPQGQLADWKLGRVHLLPGLNQVTISDESQNVNRAALLVDTIVSE